MPDVMLRQLAVDVAQVRLQGEPSGGMELPDSATNFIRPYRPICPPKRLAGRMKGVVRLRQSRGARWPVQIYLGGHGLVLAEICECAIW